MVGWDKAGFNGLAAISSDAKEDGRFLFPAVGNGHALLLLFEVLCNHGLCRCVTAAMSVTQDNHSKTGVELIAYPKFLDCDGHPNDREEQTQREEQAKKNHHCDLYCFSKPVLLWVSVMDEKLLDDRLGACEKHKVAFILRTVNLIIPNVFVEICEL